MHKYWRHLGDYARKTRHLTLLEHGALTLLLDWYYAHERALPGELDAIFRVVGARAAHEKKAACYVIKEFFSLTAAGYVNARAEEELIAYQSKSESSRRAINTRWDNKRNTDVSPTNAECNTSRARSNNQQPATNNQSTLDPSAKAPGSGGGGEICDRESQQKLPMGDTVIPAQASDEKKEGEAAGAGKPEPVKHRRSQERARNELFDGLARVCGVRADEVTKALGGEIGTALRDIKGVCAEVTVAEIERRAAAYRREWPNATLSPSALAKHWGRFGAGQKKGGGAGFVNLPAEERVEVRDTRAPVGWQRATVGLYGVEIPWAMLGEGQQAEVREWLRGAVDGG